MIQSSGKRQGVVTSVKIQAGFAPLPRQPRSGPVPGVATLWHRPAPRTHTCLRVLDAATLRPILNRLLAGFTGRIINHPADVLKTSRDEIARQLHGTPGLRVPKVVRLRGSDDVDDKIEDGKIYVYVLALPNLGDPL